jgi:uncharacterized membrane protein YgcG
MISLIVLLIMLWVAELFNLGICKTATWNCVLLSLVVLGSNAVFVCVVFFLVLGSFAVAKNRSLVDRCMSCCWKNKKGGGGGDGDGGGGGGGVDVNVDVEVELTVIGSNAGEEKNKEVVVRSVVNPLVS